MYHYIKTAFYLACIAALLTLPATVYAAVIYEDAQLMSIFMGVGTLCLLIAMYLDTKLRAYHAVSIDDEFHDMRYTLARFNNRPLR